MGNSALTKSPWRKLNGSGNSEQFAKTIESDIKSLKPNNPTGILFLGPVKAGKSSLINSIFSVEHRSKISIAHASCSSDSTTMKLSKYHGESWLKNYRFIDTMGIEGTYGEGLNEDDIKFLLEGKIKKNFMFNKGRPIYPDDEYYLSNPKLPNKSQCVVLVFDARSMDGHITPGHQKKVRFILKKIEEAEVPIVVILTKSDLLCSEVNKNANHIFRSVKVERAVKATHENFGIDIASIHPVMNFETDLELTTAKNIPILLALRQILQYACYRYTYVLNDTDN